MVYKFDKIFLFGLAMTLLICQSSTSTPIENDLLEALTMRLNGMQGRVNLLEAKNTNNEVEIQLLQGRAVENRKKIELLREKNAKKLEEIIQLKAKIDARQGPHQSPASPSKEINRNKIYSGDSSTRAVGPSSCSDLSLIGHVLDGLYLVQNSGTKKMETVLCNFGDLISQKLIGNVEVKKKNIHFYVQRESYFVIYFGTINYDLELLNEGGAMDLGSGIFTAPVDGIYHFEFAAVKDGVSSFAEVIFYAGGREIGLTYNDDGSASDMYMTVSLTASLRLNENDQAYFLNAFNGRLIGGTTHFTGWLVEEDSVSTTKNIE